MQTNNVSDFVNKLGENSNRFITIKTGGGVVACYLLGLRDSIFYKIVFSILLTSCMRSYIFSFFGSTAIMSEEAL